MKLLDQVRDTIRKKHYSKEIKLLVCRGSVLVLTSASLVWAKASHQSSTESHAWGGNEPCEAGRREVSGNNASEGIEPRNNHRVGGRHCSYRGKTVFSKPIWRGGENPTGSKAVA